MRDQIKKCGYKVNGNYAGGVLFLFVLVLAGLGCASTHKTTKTETTVTYPNEAASGDQQDGGTMEKTETTTTTTETKPERPGLISSTFHAIGYVISLPFIIIGGLFRIIFGG